MSKETLTILIEDDCIIVVYKPAGLAVQSAKVGQPDCVSILKEHIKKSTPKMKGEPYLGVVHRLDQPVAGLLVFAKNRHSAADLSRQVQNMNMKKGYLALVEGIVDAPKDLKLTDMMYKDSRKSMSVIADPSASDIKLQEAVLVYRTKKIYTEENRTLLSVQLVTGRFHQIRAQLSHMNHPIVGDVKYGAASSYPKGIALVADWLEFIHPQTGEKIEKSVDFSFGL
ncbi:MAG: RluA family pseudouridine synthase [Lachnospiraceae bacterium]|nr:RluA family pseudouridine synthase [Lachnospiraceae bacterium]